jgi:hypothetical protein
MQCGLRHVPGCLRGCLVGPHALKSAQTTTKNLWW